MPEIIEEEKKCNFEPLIDFLTYATEPSSMYSYIDMLIYEHTRLILFLIEEGYTQKDFEIHCETALIFCELRMLKDQMSLCKEITDDEEDE